MILAMINFCYHEANDDEDGEDDKVHLDQVPLPVSGLAHNHLQPSSEITSRRLDNLGRLLFVSR